jgi:hypothetical protein
MAMSNRVYRISGMKVGKAYGIYLIILLFLLMSTSSHNPVLNAQGADDTNVNMISKNELLKNSTNADSLDVLLEPTPYPVTANSTSTKFKVSFLNPNTTQLQDHVDFNVRIFKDNEQVFQATNQTGQPSVPLHATEGYMTVPMLNYQFHQAGKYLIEIPVYGILFNPIRPESANFTLIIES